MTAVTVALVVAAFAYAYQMLDQQRGMSEWEIAKKSLLAFNDALETVAWKTGATRSTRFTAQYGYLQLIPNNMSITITANVNGAPQSLSNTTYPGRTGMIQYWLGTKYVSYEPGYELYFLGNNSTMISSSSDSYGRAVINQPPNLGLVSMTLDYRVRAMKTSVIDVLGVPTNYVDIWVIKISMLKATAWSYVNEFDLQAKTLSVTTAPYRFTEVTTATSTVTVQIGSRSSQVPITLVPGTVVYNVIVANVQVSV